MDKNWMIRTKTNHILGPISKEKVLELYRNGSIKEEDEVCSGNGFWFYLREEKMVAKYLLGNEFQTFNPMSEAKDVLTVNSRSENPVSGPEEDITRFTTIDMASLREEEKTPAIVLEIVTSKSKKKHRIEKPVERSESGSKGLVKKQNYLKYIGIIGFILLFGLVYFRKTVIRILFTADISQTLTIFSSAHAQDNLPAKKKSF